MRWDELHREIGTMARAVGRFRGLTLSGPAEASMPARIQVRPVRIKGRAGLRFVRETGTRTETETRLGRDAEAALGAALNLPYARLDVLAADGDVHARLTRKGRLLISRSRASVAAPPTLAHDRVKHRPLEVEEAAAFYRTLDMLGDDGHIKASLRGKYKQIQAFVRLFEEALPEHEGVLRVIDCGCGKAYLTLALVYYLHHVRGLAVEAVGLDREGERLEQARAWAEQLGLSARVRFVRARVLDYRPDASPDVVLSLHACDTATDEALALGVRQGSRLLLAAPCCQHELHRVLKSKAFDAVLRHGILRERLADILTDALRAERLQAAGYIARVVEFIDPEATAKNLLIRAVRADRLDEQAGARYERLRAFWGVQTAIDSLLSDEGETNHDGRS